MQPLLQSLRHFAQRTWTGARRAVARRTLIGSVLVRPIVFRRWGRRPIAVGLVCCGAVIAAGCHHNNNLSNYGIGWVTVTNGSGGYGNNVRFASYVVNVDSIALTDTVGNIYTAIATVEPVDLVKLSNIAELWGSATIPADTYVSATITLDYTNAAVSLLVNGVPTAATVVLPGDAALTTTSVTVTFDPNNLLVISNSLSTTNAQRVALDFDLAASNVVNLSTTPATVTATPFFRIAAQAADSRLIRIRGPLINSNTTTGTYSVYERPFYDEVNNIGSISIFTTPKTIYTVNGTTYDGPAGLDALTQVSAGVTATEAYTTFAVSPATQDAGGQPTGTAGIFTTLYTVAGGSLETNYTENIEGDVIARSGNTLTLTNATLAGATVSLPEGYFEYLDGTTTANVLVGPSTIVTAEGNAARSNLNFNSIAVGQHITAIGVYTSTGTNNVTIDAVSPTTGSTSGQVRIQSTQLYGTLNSVTGDGLSLDLLGIDNLPVSVFQFKGDGATAAEDPVAGAYLVDTSAAAAPTLASLAAGTPLWIDGFANPFGAAPPDFLAYPNLKTTPIAGTSAVNQQTAVPASLQVVWKGAGTTTPFASSSSTALTIDTANTSLQSAIIQVGYATLQLASLGGVAIVPATSQNCPGSTSSAVQPFCTLFAVSTVTTPPTSTTPGVQAIVQYNAFGTFVTDLGKSISSSEPMTQFVVNGYFDAATKTFTANNAAAVPPKRR